jgi:AcrR family transcriptional regulator
MARPLRARRRDSRGDILRAARAEFAARGFAGAGVDRIAHRARVNKAMVYYHFASKLGLYRTVLEENFRDLTAAAAAALDPAAGAFAQLDAYLRALLRFSEARPHAIPIMLREIAEGGRNLDAGSMTLMFGLFQVVGGILDRGERDGELVATHPLLTHFIMLGSTLLYAANEPIRQHARKLRLPGSPRDIPIGPDPFLAFMNTVLRRTLGATREDPTHA